MHIEKLYHEHRPQDSSLEKQCSQTHLPSKETPYIIYP